MQTKLIKYSEWGESGIKQDYFFSLLSRNYDDNHPVSLQFTSQLTFHLLGNYRRSRLFWTPGGRFPWWSAAPCLHSARRNKTKKYLLKRKGKWCVMPLFSHQLLSPLLSLKNITNGFKWEKEGFYTFKTLALTLLLQSRIVSYVDSMKLFRHCNTFYNVTKWKAT